MSKIIEFKKRAKKAPQVVEHKCGCQQWFIEEMKGGKAYDGSEYESRFIFRCFGCGDHIDLDQLSNAEDEE